jgi:hypothetical protein
MGAPSAHESLVARDKKILVQVLAAQGDAAVLTHGDRRRDVASLIADVAVHYRLLGSF